MPEQDFQKFVIEHLIKLSDVQDKIRQDVTRLSNGQESIHRDIVRMEFTTKEKIDALFDGYLAINNKLDDHTERLQRIEDKVEKHDIQIQVLDKTKSNKRKIK